MGDQRAASWQGWIRTRPMEALRGLRDLAAQDPEGLLSLMPARPGLPRPVPPGSRPVPESMEVRAHVVLAECQAEMLRRWEDVGASVARNVKGRVDIDATDPMDVRYAANMLASDVEILRREVDDASAALSGLRALREPPNGDPDPDAVG